MALPSSLRVTPRTTLSHDLDMEERIAGATPADTIKGMFFGPIDRMVGSEGKRLPFRDYPLADYFRAVHRAAVARYPDVPISEAVRRVAGNDFEEFAESRVGRVSLALTGDVRSTLERAGRLYDLVLAGTTKVRSWRDGDVLRLSYRDYPGPVEVYPIGTIEGTCRHFGVEWEIDVDVRSARDADYTVHILTK